MSNAPDPVRRRYRWAFALYLVAAMAWLARASLNGTSGLLSGVGIALLVLGLFGAYVAWTARSHEGGQVLWRAPVQFNRDVLAQSQYFPTVKIRRARLSMGKAGGRFEVRADGVHWRAGSLLMVGQNHASGSFEIAWPEIERVSVSNVPGKIPFMGGLLTLEGSFCPQPLTGEFLGSQNALRRAIAGATNGRL